VFEVFAKSGSNVNKNKRVKAVQTVAPVKEETTSKKLKKDDLKAGHKDESDMVNSHFGYF
jgi:hypothetical protein